MKKIYQRVMAIALAGTTLLGAGLWHKYHRISPAPSKQITKNAEALPTGVSEATLADIRSSLEKQEYHISFDEQRKKLQSPNRRNNIRAYYEPGKLTVQTRVDTIGEGFKMELLNEGVFADGKLLYTPEITAKAKHHENKVQISHNAFTEEFINNEDGVRQNFIIENAPEGTRQLQVKMTAKGLQVEQRSGNELRFYSEAADGQTRNELVYSDLKCWDANKKPLSANLAYVNNRIQISVDVAGATYPVTIDPIITNGTPQNANKVLEINQTSMWLGWSVSSAGDVNGDGYSDVMVGVPMYTGGEAEEGAIFIYLGSHIGIVQSPTIIESNNPYQSLGESISGQGDFNGDGKNELLVGSPGLDNLGVPNAGAIQLYFSECTRNNLRLYNTDLSTPINHTQFAQTNFGAGLFAKSFTGRNKGKLVWETKPIGQGFSKGSNNRITNSTQSTASQNAYSNLGTTGFELKNVIDKQGPGTKVRVRVKYDPVLALTGQSYGPWRYLPAYLMGNSTAPVPKEEGGDLIETTKKKTIAFEDGNVLALATIYPNPVSSRLNIDCQDQGQVQNLRILTAAGSAVYQSNGFQPFVDVSKFSEGVYFLVITKTDGSHTTRQILIRR